MNDREKLLIAWYRSLDNICRLAVDCWLKTGDYRLVRFLSVRLFGSEAHQIAQITTPEGCEK